MLVLMNSLSMLLSFLIVKLISGCTRIIDIFIVLPDFFLVDVDCSLNLCLIVETVDIVYHSLSHVAILEHLIFLIAAVQIKFVKIFFSVFS